MDDKNPLKMKVGFNRGVIYVAYPLSPRVAHARLFFTRRTSTHKSSRPVASVFNPA